MTLELGPVRGEGDAALVLVRREGLGVIYTLRPDMARSLTEFAP